MGATMTKRDKAVMEKAFDAWMDEWGEDGDTINQGDAYRAGWNAQAATIASLRAEVARLTKALRDSDVTADAMYAQQAAEIAELKERLQWRTMDDPEPYTDLTIFSGLDNRGRRWFSDAIETPADMWTNLPPLPEPLVK